MSENPVTFNQKAEALRRVAEKSKNHARLSKAILDRTPEVRSLVFKALLCTGVLGAVSFHKDAPPEIKKLGGLVMIIAGIRGMIYATGKMSNEGKLHQLKEEYPGVLRWILNDAKNEPAITSEAEALETKFFPKNTAS